jgi:hypothetical protein
VLALAGVAPAAAGPEVPIPGPSLSPSPLPRAAAPCTIEGDGGPNTLVGTPAPDVICGYGGNDVLEGLEGDDVLDGGPGADTATWRSAPCCVSADLAAGTASGTMGADELIAVEHLEGSLGADVLRGTAAANTLSGLDTTDLLYGGDGDDMLIGGAGDDWLAGEGGANTLDGQDGADVCADAAGASCDPLSPTDGDDTRGPLDVALVSTDLVADPAVWRLRVRGRSSASRLWDEGYAVISFDTGGGDEFELHAVARWTKRGARGVLVADGGRGTSGRLKAKRTGGRGVRLRVPLARLDLHPERPYYRWAVQTIYTGAGCRPCFDAAPQAGAYPQPV